MGIYTADEAYTGFPEDNQLPKLKEASRPFVKGGSTALAGQGLWINEKRVHDWSGVLHLIDALASGTTYVQDSQAAPPTNTAGDIYLTNQTLWALDVNTIAWQSGTTVRYTFNGTPDLSGVAANDYLVSQGNTNSEHDGRWVISAVNDGSDWVEVTNAAITDSTKDEATDAIGTGSISHADWDGVEPNSWARYDGTGAKWYGIPAVKGMTCWVAGKMYRFDGSIWRQGSVRTVLLQWFSPLDTDIAVSSGKYRIPITITGSPLSITTKSIQAMIGTAPVGADAIWDININGSTIFTTQANRPTVSDGTNDSGQVTNMDVTAVSNGEYFEIDTDQVGSVTAGQNASVTIELEVIY